MTDCVQKKKIKKNKREKLKDVEDFITFSSTCIRIVKLIYQTVVQYFFLGGG